MKKNIPYDKIEAMYSSNYKDWWTLMNLAIDKQNEMEINEIKKALYREKPIAKRVDSFSDNLLLPVSIIYRAELTSGDVEFDVPLKEMGDIPFEDKVPAQLLIRWLCSTSNL